MLLKLADLEENKGELEKKVLKQLKESRDVLMKEEIYLGTTTRRRASTGDQRNVLPEQMNEVSNTQKKIAFKVKVPRQEKDTGSYTVDGDSSDNDQTETIVQTKHSKYWIKDHPEPLIIKNLVTSEDLDQVRKTSVSDLKHSIDERFHAQEREYLVLSKCKFLDIKTWPSDNLLSFCNNDVEYLIEHFSIPLQKANVAESDVCVGEFKDLKSFYGPQIDDFKSEEFWALVYRSKRKRFEIYT